MRRWETLAKLLNDDALQSFAEIGVKEGRLTAYILEHCPQVQVVACDPWCAFPATDDPLAETYAEWDFAELERQFVERVEPWKDRLTFHRMTGLELSRRIPDASLDVAFIDARHDHDSVLEDIATWHPKVKPGGWMTGHDFNHRWPGVQRAVADHFDLMRVVSCEDSVWMYQKASL